MEHGKETKAMTRQKKEILKKIDEIETFTLCSSK